MNWSAVLKNFAAKAQRRKEEHRVAEELFADFKIEFSSILFLFLRLTFCLSAPLACAETASVGRSTVKNLDRKDAGMN